MATIARVSAVSTGFSGQPGFHQFYFGVAVPPFNDPAAVLACNRVRDAYTAARTLWPNLWSVSIDSAVDLVDEASGELQGIAAGAASTVVGNNGAAGYYAAPVGIETRYFTPDVADGHLVKGRTYHVPLANALGDNNSTPGASVVTLGAAFGTAITSAGATDCVFGVWHRPVYARVAGVRTLTRPGSFHGVTSTDCPDKFVVLRSRRD